MGHDKRTEPNLSPATPSQVLRFGAPSFRHVGTTPPRLEPTPWAFDAAVKALLAETYASTGLDFWPTISVGNVFVMASSRLPMSPREAVALVASYLAHLVESGDYAESTVIKACALMTRFAAYAERARRVTDVRKVGPADVDAFIHAPVLKDEQRREAAERTKENRYWAVDLLFRTLRGLDFYEGDPLLDGQRYPRISTSSRPLVDAEIERCRRFAPQRLDDTLGPARIALAEAMATAGEIPQVTVGDFDPAHERVWLSGTGHLHGRWAALLPWGLDKIERRVADLGGSAADPLQPIAYCGKRGGGSSSSAASDALRKVLDRAGYTRAFDVAVSPKSFRAWGARRLYDETRDLQEVAHRLGVQSLETARQIIQLPSFPPDDPPPHRRPQ